MPTLAFLLVNGKNNWQCSRMFTIILSLLVLIGSKGEIDNDATPMSATKRLVMLLSVMLSILMLGVAFVGLGQLGKANNHLAYSTYQFIVEPLEHGKHKIYVQERRLWGMMEIGTYPASVENNSERRISYLKDGKKKYVPENDEYQEGYTDNRGFHEY